jgi:Flp pilus assembly pilin Flp
MKRTLRPGARAGVTAIEYALLAGLVAVAVLGAVLLVGGEVTALYDRGAAEVSRIPGK